MTVQKVGSEIQVNQATAGSQLFPELAIDATGNFIVLFTEALAGNQPRQVYRRHFDALGTPLSDAIRMGMVSGAAQNATVAMDSLGNWMATATFSNGSANTPEIIPFRGTGTTGGLQPGLINMTTTNAQQSARIARNMQGDTVVVWQSNNQDGSGWGVYARLYDARGIARSGEILVNTITNGNQMKPDVAVDGQGNFVVTWESRNPDNKIVFARRFDRDGQSPDSQEFRVNQRELRGGNSDAAGSPRVAIDQAGNFVVTWAGQDSLTSETNITDIYARRFRADGVSTTSDFRINQTTAGQQVNPAIAMDEHGQYVITWSSETLDGSHNVYARRLFGSGSFLSDEFLVNTHTPGDQRLPAVAIQQNGDFVIGWQSYGQDAENSWGVYAQRFEVASAVSFGQPTLEVLEGGQATVTLTRSRDYQLASTVQISVTGGTATSGQDFRLPTQTLTFNPGETQKTFTINALQDARVEGNETIRLSLVAGDRAVLGNRATTTVTIQDTTRQGTNRADTLNGTVASDTLLGLGGNDILRGQGGNDVLIGGAGNDILVGGGGNDTLNGVNTSVARPGRGEIDRMNGGAGRDRFVLGDTNRVFYDDGNRNSQGRQDYALIQDFNPSQDRIQLHGQRSNYVLGRVPNMAGTGVFLRAGQNTPELIAVVQGGSALNLNSNVFQFVG